MNRFVRNLVSCLCAIVAFSALGETKVGIVFDRGGKDDKSFNASAYKGLMEAKAKLGIHVKYVEAADDNAFEPMLKAFATKKYDLVIGVGFSQGEAIKKVALAFPDSHFAIIDARVEAENVRSLLFAEHEGAFLMGAIAALTSKGNTVGFVGGMDVPLIRRFELGYEAGAKHINPKIRIISNFVGVTGEAWNNPPKAKELGLAQYSGGADVIFVAAGASGSGIFDAAEEKKKLAIGVDSNQNWVKPGFILTSMLKRVDAAVFKLCEDAVKGAFTGGVAVFDLRNQGIDYAQDEYNAKVLTPEVVQKIEAIKAEIMAGKLVVPDYFALPKK